MMKYENEQQMTEDEFKKIVLADFKTKVDNEIEKLGCLNEKLKKILAEPDSEDIRKNKSHYEGLILEQKSVVRNREISYNLLNQALIEHKECAICSEEITGVYSIMKDCQHYFCKSCLDIWMKRNSVCPMCRNLSNEYYSLGNDANKSPYSTKIMKLLEIISGIDRQIIIFTQFEKIIQKLMQILIREGISVVEFSEKNIISFRNNEVKVLILSSKNNACGLDLSFASDIVIFEPIKGNYVKDIEKQIIGRIWRINQKRECNVHRLYIQDTIEEEIYKDML